MNRFESTFYENKEEERAHGSSILIEIRALVAVRNMCIIKCIESLRPNPTRARLIIIVYIHIAHRMIIKILFRNVRKLLPPSILIFPTAECFSSNRRDNVEVDYVVYEG